MNDKNTGSSSKFRFGVLGCGDIARKFCRAVELIPDAEVAAAASSSRDRAERLAEEFHIPAAYGDYREMLEKEHLDGVYIATVHRFHFDNIMLCLDYRTPALCEKCFLLTRREAEQVFSRAKKEGVYVTEMMWSRFLPGMRKAREWIRQGKLGEITSASYSVGFAAREGHRVLNPEIAGGALYDIGVYGIEGLTYLIGQPLRHVRPSVTFSSLGVDIEDKLLLEFESCAARLECTVLRSVNNEARVRGTQGTLWIPRALESYECHFQGRDGRVESFHSQPLENGFLPEITSAMDDIRNGRLESSAIPHADTLLCAEIFDICLGTGRPTDIG